MQEVQLAQSVASKGITYRTGMIVSHNSVGGLPDFAEISQICLLHSSVYLIVKELCGWYKEHYRAFELTTSTSSNYYSLLLLLELKTSLNVSFIFGLKYKL